MATLEIETDKEGILDAITVLIEKKILPKSYMDGFEIKITGLLRLDLINEKLLVTF